MIGFGGPGQRGIEKGGRDQDLLTPLWQGVALCVLGAWIIGWFVALSLVLGAVLGYALSLAALCVRARRLTAKYTSIPWLWIWVNLAIHTGIAFALDLIWTPYLLPWTPWIKLWWSLLYIVLIAVGALLFYTIVIRVFDPHYPSPRKAVEVLEWMRPWERDSIDEVLELAEPQDAQLVTLEIIEGDKRRYLTGIEITPGLQRFCKGVLDGSVTFSEGGAAGCEWKPKAAFIDLRDQMLEREMIAWKNTGNTRSGYHIRPVARRALVELAALPCPGG